MRPRFTTWSWLKLLASVALVLSVSTLGGQLRSFPPSARFALAKPGHSDPGISRDWKSAPAIAELDTTEDVFAVGDVHGDYDRLVALLAAGKVIAGAAKRPDDVEWTAGKAVLVCTGDLIDKGSHSLKVIALFRALEKQAAKAGGQVVVLMGNHEAEFLADPDNDDKALEFIQEMTKHDLQARDVAACRDTAGIGAYLNARPLAARVNDWFFAHAGDTQGYSLKELRAQIEDEAGTKGYRSEVLLGDKGLLEARLHKRPWWEKKDESPDKSEARLRRYVEALGVHHLVFGHQPGNVSFADGSSRVKGTCVQKFNGLVFLIDVGMSEAIGYSKGALLQIRAGTKPSVVVHYPDRGPETLWKGP